MSVNASSPDVPDVNPFFASKAGDTLGDQQLFSSAGAQLVIARDVIHAPTVATHSAMRVGQPVFIYAGAAVNAVVVLVALVEAVKTRLWRGTPKLNFADVKGVVVASSAGGEGVARSVKRAYGEAGAGEGWVGSAADRTAGAVEVVMKRGGWDWL